MERKTTEKKWVKSRVKGYVIKKGKNAGKKVKGYEKQSYKYPRKYRTFRSMGGCVRFVEITKIKGKESIKILDSNYRGILSIEQPDKFKKSFPNTKFMTKHLDRNEIEAFEKIAKGPYEKSYAIDFERYLVHPERYAITKGGYSSTMKIGDFELFGHSHPCVYKYQRLPSATDLKNAVVFKPEFIIAKNEFGPNWGETELYFFNIFDLEKYDNWKERHKNAGRNEEAISDTEITIEIAKLVANEKNPKKKAELRKDWHNNKITKDTLLDSEIGREIFFERTGVKLYPYDRELVRVSLELLDEPRPGYAYIPATSQENLKEWTASSKPYINMEKTKEAIQEKRKEIDQIFIEKDRTKRGLADQLTESQYVLSYLRDCQKEDIMSPYALEEEITKELEHYKEIARKIEEITLKEQKEYDTALKYFPEDETQKLKKQLQETKQLQVSQAQFQKIKEQIQRQKEEEKKEQTSSMPLSSRDQTVRWLSLSKEQLNAELNDINRYPTVESLKEASESLLTRQEKNLKTRKRIVEIVEKKITEDRAISYLGR